MHNSVLGGAVATACRVDAIIAEAQSFDGPAGHQVFADDFVHVTQADKAIPHRFRINDNRHSMLALVETAGGIDADTITQA